MAKPRRTKPFRPVGVARLIADTPMPRCNLLICATVAGLLGRPAPVLAVEAAETASQLQEVVVTANRREESVLDVPYNITAVSGKDIDRAGITDLQSLGHVVPGLTIPDLGPRANSSNSNIVIRGLNTNDPGQSSFLPWASVPLVATYVDEVPLFVNMQLDDIARVEVLKGPQGTLYGSGAVGGTIRLLHNAPDPTKFAARASIEGSKTDYAGDPSYAASGLINVPLGETAALRVSAGYRKYAGFINGPNAVIFDAKGQPVLADPAHPLTSGLKYQSLKDINDANSIYGRAALLWKVTPAFDAELSFQHQRDSAQAFQTESLGAPRRENLTLIPHAPGTDTTNLVALTLTGDVGFATVTSSTSYYDFKNASRFDNSPFIENYNSQSPAYYGNYPRVTSPFFNDISDRSLTEELRLVSKTGGAWDYAVGAFYRNEKANANQVETVPGFAAYADTPGSANAVNAAFGSNFKTFSDFVTLYNGGTQPSSLSPTDLVYLYQRHSTFKDKALYGELTRHITPAWQVTGGARVFWQDYSQSLHQEIPVGGFFFSTITPPDALGTTLASSTQSFSNHIFKLNTSYELTASTRVYATFSEGFRHGGTNATPVGNCVFCDVASVVPFRPDEAKNYEIGYKGLISDRLRFSAAIYRINWADIQIQTFGKSGDNLVENGGKAKSQGLELEFTAQVSHDLSATVGYALTDATIQQDFKIVDGGVTLLSAKSGDRLPFVPRTSLTGALDFRHALGSASALTARLDAAYRSNVQNALNSSQTNFVQLGGYTIVNGSVGYEFSRELSGRLFINNLTNQQGASAGGAPNFADARYGSLWITTPRTIGVRLDYRFD